MVRMVRPTPSNQHIYIQQKSHGNEASISCTDSVVSGGRCGAGAKIVTPVSGQRVVVTSAAGVTAAFACLRRNSDTLSRSHFAKARIARASSSVTLNVNVFMRYYGITFRDLTQELLPFWRFGWLGFIMRRPASTSRPNATASSGERCSISCQITPAIQEEAVWIQRLRSRQACSRRGK